MKILKNILLLTALPITTFVVPQILSSCYESKNQKNEDLEEKGYTKFDNKNMDSVTTLDNNMYDVGIAFGNSIITDSKEEIGEVAFIHWDGHSSDLNENWKTREFIIDLTKMKNLENIHANLRYFMIGAYQSYCLSNLDKINETPMNPWFRIVFPSSLKKLVYLENAYTTIDLRDIYKPINSILVGFKNIYPHLSYKNIDQHLNYYDFREKNEFFIKNIRYKYDLQYSTNLESFQMPSNINFVENKISLYGDLNIPKSVKEYIPPILDWVWKEGVKVYVHKGFSYIPKEKHEKYKLTFNFSYKSIVTDIFKQKKKNMNDYLTEEERKYNSINDISLFPLDFWTNDRLYYNEFHIDKSFQSIDGIKLLFGGPIQYIGDPYNLNDDDHRAFFDYILTKSRIPKYHPKDKIIYTGQYLATIKWI